MRRELPFEGLWKACNPKMMGCYDSSQINSLKSIIGQERAVKALQFGLGIKEKGLDKSAGETLQKLDQELALYAIKHLMDDVQENF